MDLPFNITGLLAFELFVMHWVESRRGYDLRKPGSMDQDPIFRWVCRGVGGGALLPSGWLASCRWMIVAGGRGRPKPPSPPVSPISC